MGLDVHKRTVYLTALNGDGNIEEHYEYANTRDSWKEFRDRYLDGRPEIALEISTSGKYVARKLRDKGFSVHLPVPQRLLRNTRR